MRIADRRSRSTFWLDDAFVDRCGPWLGRYPGGTAALAIYTVLARHAGRDSEAWPSVARLALYAGCSQSTVRRALHLLELGGLVAVFVSVDGATGSMRSNTYVLLTPPADFPQLAEDPKDWPAVDRDRVSVRLGGDGRRMVEDWRASQRESMTPCHGDRGAPTAGDRGPLSQTTGDARATDQLEGNLGEGPSPQRAKERTLSERRAAAKLAWATDDPARPAHITAELWATTAIETAELKAEIRARLAAG